MILADGFISSVQALSPPVPQALEVTSYASVAKRAAPAVVNIYTKRREKTRSAFSPFANDPLFREFFGGRLGDSFGMMGIPRERVVQSLGSGVIIAPEGLIITSYHVIEGSEQITVVLMDRREFAADLVAVDKSSDLALLRINTGGITLPFLVPKPYHSLEVGDVVLAIGNPFGVGQTVMQGIISALSRAASGVSDRLSFIQTDAAINPGNSGGALVSMDGQLVGINAAIYSKSGGSLGIGFAIPAGMIRALVEASAGDGVVRRPWLGVSVQPVDYETAESLGLSLPQGVLISDVAPESPAARAKLQTGDILLSIDNYPLYGEHDLHFFEGMANPQRQSLLEILRNGQVVQARVKITVPKAPGKDAMHILKGEHLLDGITVADVTPYILRELEIEGVSEGVVIMDIAAGSPALRVGLRPGDVILQLGRKDITSVKQLKRLVRDLPEHSLRLSMLRNGQVLQLVVQQ